MVVFHSQQVAQVYHEMSPYLVQMVHQSSLSFVKNVVPGCSLNRFVVHPRILLVTSAP
jgi:hypothetical protein